MTTECLVRQLFLTECGRNNDVPLPRPVNILYIYILNVLPFVSWPAQVIRLTNMKEENQFLK